MQSQSSNDDFEAISLLGDTLQSSNPSKNLINRYNEKKKAFETDPENLDNLIWYGRFTAYLGNYQEAIVIYTNGLEKFPNNPRLFRHRGHRYITLREFDKAIFDFTMASRFVEGTENQIEADGMPNERNIPVSTLHGNIYYHLGLAHYLKGEFVQSLIAYKKCLKTSTSPDNQVSATHWIYMNIRRMGREQSAANYLRNIDADMDVIENTSYYNACLFYKGELKLQDVYDPNAEVSPSNSAISYAVGNWHLYNGRPRNANKIFNKIIEGGDWASFGYIAAEVELAK
jgi:tetratricopeptide (TPR) repeat protein